MIKMIIIIVMITLRPGQHCDYSTGHTGHGNYHNDCSNDHDDYGNDHNNHGKDHTDNGNGHTDQNEIIRSSVRTTLSLVKAGLATTGQKATTLRVRFTVTDGSDGIDGNDGKSNFIVNYYGD